MSQRYERVSHAGGDDADDDHEVTGRPRSLRRRPSGADHDALPSSPPPSFRSHASSPRRRRSVSDSDPLVSDAERNLADAFDASSDSEAGDGDEEGGAGGGSGGRRLAPMDERQRVMSGRPSATPSMDEGDASRTLVSSSGAGAGASRPHLVQRIVTRFPLFAPLTASQRNYGGGGGSDGVFANLSAKPERGEVDLMDEKPPTYEQAAADATPPYWENTIFAPSGTASDEVYIDGLPVGSFFSFIWNGMISTSFQLVGFLLTYLLHSTHAARNGSKAGLGITLIQYGFSLKSATSGGGVGPDDGATIPGGPGGPDPSTPSDPNSHDFDPNDPAGNGVFMPGPDDSTAGHVGFAAMGASDWFAYGLMVVGWFVLIRAISEYLKARRHEALVLQSPGRGLNVAIVAAGEEPSHSV